MMKSSNPRAFSSGMIGTKNGTCGELSRSIQIFFRTAVGFAALVEAGVLSSASSMVDFIEETNPGRKRDPAKRRTCDAHRWPDEELSHHFNAQAARLLAAYATDGVLPDENEFSVLIARRA